MYIYSNICGYMSVYMPIIYVYKSVCIELTIPQIRQRHLIL